MRKIHIVFALLLIGAMCSFKSSKDEIQWYDWNEGYQLAAKKNKIVIVDVFTSWCGWCKKMDRDTYSDKDVISSVNKNFIAIRLNPEKTDVVYKVDTLSLNGYQLLNVLTNGERTGYPTTVFLNARLNQVLKAESGYQDVATFKKNMDDALGQSKDKSKKKKGKGSEKEG
jgi:thioredoxin-related protein